MPELPEVEHLRCTLAPRLTGRVVRRVEVRRRDVIRSARNGGASRIPLADLRRGLLERVCIERFVRRGKQLVIAAPSGAPAMIVQLGMSGQLIFVPRETDPPREDHIHITWHFDDRVRGDRLIFRDPRRFGGITLAESVAAVQSRHWARLGADALTIQTGDVRSTLKTTRRPIKAALLDQRLLAGVGNIYADESLHRSGLHPLRPGCSLSADEVRRLCSAIRVTLRKAIKAGGTTLRDYVDGNGRDGRNRTDLLVYARAGTPCKGCGTALEHLVVAQRTTTFCPACQPSTTYPHLSKRSTRTFGKLAEREAQARSRANRRTTITL